MTSHYFSAGSSTSLGGTGWCQTAGCTTTACAEVALSTYNHSYCLGIRYLGVFLDCDWGSSAVRWTAPYAGSFNITLNAGVVPLSGCSDQCTPLYGNEQARNIVMLVNDVVTAENRVTGPNACNSLNGGTGYMTQQSFVRSLSAGDNVTLFLPQVSNGGNAAVDLFITLVASPSQTASSAVSTHWSLADDFSFVSNPS